MTGTGLPYNVRHPRSAEIQRPDSPKTGVPAASCLYAVLTGLLESSRCKELDFIASVPQVVLRRLRKTIGF